eukprot:g33494.t1
MAAVEYEQWQEDTHLQSEEPQMYEITPDYVNMLTSPTDGFLCELEHNVYNIQFVNFKIRCLDEGQERVLFDLGAGDLPAPPPPDIGENACRFIRYHFGPEFLGIHNIGDYEVHNFRMIERHYFRDQLITSYDFTMPFESYSFYGLSHWLSEADALLDQIDQISLSKAPKTQELALVDKKDELLSAQTQLRRQMGALLEEPLTRRERPKAEQFLEAQRQKLLSQASKERAASAASRLQELLAKLKTGPLALETKEVRDIEAQMKEADLQWNDLEPTYVKWQAGRHSFKSNAELQSFKRRYEDLQDAKKVRDTAPDRLEAALRRRRAAAATAEVVTVAAGPGAGWAAARKAPTKAPVPSNTGRGAAAVALDKPKAAPKTSWTSGVTLVQRMRAEAAAQVRGAKEDVVESSAAPATTSWVLTLQVAVANMVLEELLRRESWSLDDHEATTHLSLLAERLPLQSPLGFRLPFQWSSFLALEVDGGPKRRSRRGQSDALEHLRHNLPRFLPFYLTIVLVLVILHSLSHFGLLMWTMALQTALLLLQLAHLLLWIFFVRSIWLMHIFIKVFCVALFVGHAYSTNEAKDDE